MGVMSCSRRDCENIMCNTHVSGIGYICNDCQAEFKRTLDYDEYEVVKEDDIIKELKKFMETTPTQGSDEKITIREFFSKNT